MFGSITQTKNIPIVGNFDVVVAGGGPAGIGAAIAAARNGARTILIENLGFLGGGATAMLVTGLPGRQFVINIMAGIPKEFFNRLAELPPWKDREGTPKRQFADLNPNFFTFDQEAFKYIALKMLNEAGVTLLVETRVVDSITENNVIKGVIVENKSGRQAIRAKMVVDCTGDGDVAAWAGAPYEKGRKDIDGKADDLMMPASMVWFARGVDRETYKKYLKEDPNFEKAVAKAREAGDLKEGESFRGPRQPAGNGRLDEWRDQSIWVQGGVGGGRLDPTNGEDIARESVRLRMKVYDQLMFLRRYVLGWEDAYISNTATTLGLRESRRIIGEKSLRWEDTERITNEDGVFDDVICISNHRYHRPKLINMGMPFMVPYGCLVPKVIDNLLVAGRCISQTHNALANGGTRDLTTSMATGQAAGTAVALALKHNTTPRKLNINTLQNTLKNQGVILEEPKDLDLNKMREEFKKEGVYPSKPLFE